jgi:hypothetical protein
VEQRNKEQKMVLDSLTKDTEYEEQMEILSRDINKWKNKYKLLTTYEKEEENNFKAKFEMLISVEESRARIKGSIIQTKYGRSSTLSRV